MIYFIIINADQFFCRDGAALPHVVKSGLSKTAYIGIGVGAGVVFLIVGFLIFLAVRMKRKAENERKNNPFGKA